MRKKLLFFTKILLIIVLFTTLIPITFASARAGGSTSSSYSSSSYSGGFFNRGYRGYYGRSRYIYANPFIVFLATAIILLVIYWSKIRKFINTGSSHSHLTSKNKEAVQKIKSLSAVDEIWNLNNLEFYVTQAFWAIQSGWTNRDLNLCLDYLDTNLIREYEYKIKNMIYAHEVNILNEINLKQCMPIEVSIDNYNKNYYVSFYIKAKLRDYITSDINGAVIRGNTEMMTFSEIWIFKLSKDRQWKLCEIQKL